MVPRFCPVCGKETAKFLTTPLNRGQWLATNRDLLNEEDLLECYCKECGEHFWVAVSD